MYTSTGIRRWNYFAAEQLLVYDIAKYRWCENVERFHKSNNIMYVCFMFCRQSLSVLRLSDLVSSSSAGLLWISKRKCGTRSVTILNARTSGPQVCNAAIQTFSNKKQLKDTWSVCGVIKCGNKTCLRNIFNVTGYPLPQEICVSYIMKLVCLLYF